VADPTAVNTEAVLLAVAASKGSVLFEIEKLKEEIRKLKPMQIIQTVLPIENRVEEPEVRGGCGSPAFMAWIKEGSPHEEDERTREEDPTVCKLPMLGKEKKRPRCVCPKWFTKAYEKPSNVITEMYETFEEVRWMALSCVHNFANESGEADRNNALKILQEASTVKELPDNRALLDDSHVLNMATYMPCEARWECGC